MLGEDSLSRIPNQPPRRVEDLPGLRASRAIAARTLWLPMAFLAIGTLALSLALLQDREAMLALRPSETTQGRADGVERGNGCGGHGLVIRYSFSSKEWLPFRGEESLCARTRYDSVGLGDSLPIVYVKDDPTVNAIAGARDPNAMPVFLIPIFPLFGLLFFLPLFLPRYLQLLRDRKLFRSGVLATGNVVFVVKAPELWPGWPTSIRSEVYVRTRLPSGEEREVRAACSNDWLLVHLAPGAEVMVAYEKKGRRAMLLQNYLR